MPYKICSFHAPYDVSVASINVHFRLSRYQAESRTQVMALEENARDFNLTYYAMDDKRQGIVHIIGPEQVSSDSEGEIGMGCLIW